MLTNLQLGVSDKYGQASAYGYENFNNTISIENLDGAVIDGTTAGTYTRFYSAPLNAVYMRQQIGSFWWTRSLASRTPAERHYLYMY